MSTPFDSDGCRGSMWSYKVLSCWALSGLSSSGTWTPTSVSGTSPLSSQSMSGMFKSLSGGLTKIQFSHLNVQNVCKYKHTLFHITCGFGMEWFICPANHNWFGVMCCSVCRGWLSHPSWNTSRLAWRRGRKTMEAEEMGGITQIKKAFFLHHVKNMIKHTGYPYPNITPKPFNSVENRLRIEVRSWGINLHRF